MNNNSDTINTKIINNAALITGASSGLGAEFAIQIAEKFELNIVLVARRVKRMEDLRVQLLDIFKKRGLEKLRVEIIELDLSNIDNTKTLKALTDSLSLNITFLVNNAGYGTVGPLSEIDNDREQKMVILNSLAPVILTQLFLPDMMKGKHGYIINVSSVAGFQPMPYMCVYSSTKAFLTNFSVGTHFEVRKNGINVTALCPGPTESEFHLAAGLPEKITFTKAMSATPVVASSIQAVLNGNPLIVPGIMNKLIVLLNRILPKSLSALIVGSILKGRKSFQ